MDKDDKPQKVNKALQKKKLFAKAYVSNGLNATQAYKAVNPKAKNNTANVQGSVMLNKPATQKEIIKLLPTDNESMAIIKEAYHAKRPTSIDWNNLHKYMTTDLTLKGLINTKEDKTPNVNVALVIDRGKD